MPFKMTCEPDDYEGPWPDLSVSAPAAPQMTDEEMDDAVKRDEAEQERAHIAYLRGIDEGKRQAAAPQQAEPHGEIARPWCHYSMLPDHVCNKCGRVHGYSRPPRPALDDAMYRVAIQQRDAAWAESASLREALHQISLCSQNSMSSKDECGRIARRALEGK